MHVLPRGVPRLSQVPLCRTTPEPRWGLAPGCGNRARAGFGEPSLGVCTPHPCTGDRDSAWGVTLVMCKRVLGAARSDPAAPGAPCGAVTGQHSWHSVAEPQELIFPVSRWNLFHLLLLLSHPHSALPTLILHPDLQTTFAGACQPHAQAGISPNLPVNPSTPQFSQGTFSHSLLQDKICASF